MRLSVRWADRNLGAAPKDKVMFRQGKVKKYVSKTVENQHEYAYFNAMRMAGRYRNIFIAICAQASASASA